MGSLSDEKATHVQKLLKLNHDNYSILYNSYRFHNHSPHFLGSAYLFDGSSTYLQNIYEDLVVRNNLDVWKPSPGTITLDNYRAYLGKGEYQRAWVDFFELQINNGNRDGQSWQSVVLKFLFDLPLGDCQIIPSSPSASASASAPMFYCLGTDLGHPLIHLGYAFELNSPDLAAEALGLVATCYDEQYATIVTMEPAEVKIAGATAQNPTSNLFEIFQRVAVDKSLPKFTQPGDEHIEGILADEKHTETITAYMNSWDLGNDPEAQLPQAYRLASLLLISTAPKLGGHGYDFFLVHVLTSLHAVNVLLPHLRNVPRQYPTAGSAASTLLREWLLIALLAYVAQQRPRLDSDSVREIQLRDGQDWEYVRQHAITGRYCMDAHFVKACRALHTAAAANMCKLPTRAKHDDSDDKDDEEEDWLLKCTVRFVTEFDGWGGFDTEAPDAETVKQNRKKDGIHVR